MRYVACKKKINEGGVIPCDVPHHLFHHQHEEWAGVKPRKGKKRSNDGMEIEEKIKKEQNRGTERGERRKNNDECKMSRIATNPKQKERKEGRKRESS